MSTVSLRIGFNGLCLFVPGVTAMRVLLPHETGSDHASRGLDRHVAVLAWDKGHEIASGADRKHTGELQYRSLFRKELSVKGGGPAPATTALPDIADFAPIFGADLIDPAHFGRVPPNALAARVLLESGKLDRCAPGYCWEFPKGSGSRNYAPAAEWLLTDVPAGHAFQLQLELKFLDVPASEPVPPLYPINNEIRLDVLNLPVHEFPKPTEPGRPTKPPFYAEHFVVYYKLFETAPGTEHKPVGRVVHDPGQGPCHPVRPESEFGGGQKGSLPGPSAVGYTYTCVMGQASKG